MKVKNCKHCGNEYVSERTGIRNGRTRKYCLSACCYADRSGKPRGSIHTAESRARISAARSGSKLSSEHKTAIGAGLVKSYAEGRREACPPTTKEWKKAIGAGMKRAYAEGRITVKPPVRRGPDASNWKGGITPYFTKIRNAEAMQKWRRRVFSRDNYTCLKCGARNGNGKHIELQAHHIIPLKYYPVLAYDENNGATLCVPCHQQITRKGFNDE